jgi:hypothetical protein
MRTFNYAIIISALLQPDVVGTDVIRTDVIWTNVIGTNETGTNVFGREFKRKSRTKRPTLTKVESRIEEELENALERLRGKPKNRTTPIVNDAITTGLNAYNLASMNGIDTVPRIPMIDIGTATDMTRNGLETLTSTAENLAPASVIGQVTNTATTATIHASGNVIDGAVGTGLQVTTHAAAVARKVLGGAVETGVGDIGGGLDTVGVAIQAAFGICAFTVGG